MREALVDPWLLVVWPGMGNVAVTAAEYLIEDLGATKLVDIPAGDHFDLERVEIRDGLARVGWVPTLSLYGWKNPDGGKDLLIFVGESQPTRRGYDFCLQLLRIAQRYGVARIFTFAAVATQIHPRKRPRIFGVANEKTLLRDLVLDGVERLREGQISGLNGVMLVAAADLGLEGVCLLGEIPFFAISVPNPKASLEVLKVFSRMARFRIAFARLGQHAREYEDRLTQLVDQSPSAEDPNGSGHPELEIEFTTESIFDDHTDDGDDEADITGVDRRRIENLFEEASHDRAKALDLKNELDRLGAFTEYEDRFLDLFR